METVSGRNEEEGFFLSFGRDGARLFLCRASRFKGGGGDQLISLSPRRVNVGEEVVVGTNVISSSQTANVC